jgi:tetratricopeptide (TPR) repeat protein
MNLVLAGALLGLITAQAAEQRTYADLIAAYRRGEITPAVAEAQRRTDRPFVEAADRWLDVARRAKEERELEVALLLHTEVLFTLADAMWLSKESTGFSACLARVKRLHDVLASFDRQAPFLRGWYLLMGSYLQARNASDFGPGFDFVTIGVAAFPDDPEMLLMAGASKELTWWTAPDNSQRRPDGKAGVRQKALREARDYFRKSIAINPGPQAETHLRLGRTLTLLEEYDAAASQLEPLRALSGNPTMSYIANLFLGDVHERLGNFTAAAGAYETALRLVPLGQAAQVAASQLAYREGSRKRAAEVVTRALSETKPQVDPWWWYIRGQAWLLDPRLNAARRTVQR